jgi:putative membrane protein
LWILILVVLGLGVFLYKGRKRENTMAILDNRFAKGEIPKEAYEEQNER